MPSVTTENHYHYEERVFHLLIFVPPQIPSVSGFDYIIMINADHVFIYSFQGKLKCMSFNKISDYLKPLSVTVFLTISNLVTKFLDQESQAHK